MQKQPLDLKSVAFHCNKVMLQHEVPRYFPLQSEKGRKDAKAKVAPAAGPGRKAGFAGLSRENEKTKAA
jgi:hypothetical protein